MFNVVRSQCHALQPRILRYYSDLTFSLPGLDQGDVPLLLAVLSEKQCKDTLGQALLKD
jgi:hypothetical protein